MLETKFTQLVGCDMPLQLAGMPGINTIELAAAVSNAGGLGMISGTHMDPNYLCDTLDNLKKLTGQPFGVNFLIPFLDKEALEVASSKARVVEFFYGDPSQELVDIVHNHSALASWQIGSVKEAIQAEKVGCDLIVAQGVEAGGHVRGDTKLLMLLSDVLDTLWIPVIASGGLGSSEEIADIIEAGASAARVGTRFLAAKESGAHPKYIQALIEANSEDTVLTETFSVGWPHAHHRVLKSCVNEVNAFEGDIVGERDIAGEKKPVPKGSIALPTKQTTGKIEAMALYASKSVGNIGTVESAYEIVNDLVKDI